MPALSLQIQCKLFPFGLSQVTIIIYLSVVGALLLYMLFLLLVDPLIRKHDAYTQPLHNEEDSEVIIATKYHNKQHMRTLCSIASLGLKITLYILHLFIQFIAVLFCYCSFVNSTCIFYFFVYF